MWFAAQTCRTGARSGAIDPARPHRSYSLTISTGSPPMANKLRHIAISVRDPEATAKFFEQAFGMTRAGNAQRGVYMTDGIMNVALLNFGDEPIAGFEDQKNVTGLIHFGMWVDSVDQIDKAI